jgi:hypothetical protein
MAKDEIVWTTEKVALGDLINWEKNPVKLTKEDARQIQISLDRFGQVLPLVANAPTTHGKRRMIDGHQRKMVEMASKRWGPKTKVDVRVPSRLLTSAECDELSLRLRRNRGDTDMHKLVLNFDLDSLLKFGFEKNELSAYDFHNPQLAEEESNIRPKQYLRILISIPLAAAGKVKKYIEPIEEMEGIEIIYGAN